MRKQRLVSFSIIGSIGLTGACSGPAEAPPREPTAIELESTGEGQGTCALGSPLRPPVPLDVDGGLVSVGTFDGVTCAADPASGTCGCRASCQTQALALDCDGDQCRCTVDGHPWVGTAARWGEFGVACPVEATSEPTTIEKQIWVYTCGFPH
jgi:hypothetical protein